MVLSHHKLWAPLVRVMHCGMHCSTRQAPSFKLLGPPHQSLLRPGVRRDLSVAGLVEERSFVYPSQVQDGFADAQTASSAAWEVGFSLIMVWLVGLTVSVCLRKNRNRVSPVLTREPTNLYTRLAEIQYSSYTTPLWIENFQVHEIFHAKALFVVQGSEGAL